MQLTLAVKNKGMTKAVQWITGMLMVLVAGVFWGTWFALSRTMEHFSAAMFIAIGKDIIRNVSGTMPVIMPGSIIGLALLLIMGRKQRDTYFYCILGALVLFIAALVITVGIEVPIDNQLKNWTADTVPANWQSIRAKWETFHMLRTFISLAGVGAFIAAVLSKNVKY
jgi:uncharacterized membrane protein